MNKRMLLLLFLFLLAASVPAFASLEEAASTTAEGAINLPLSLVKLVGGAVWTVGEVIALPFRIIF